jgi:hypothetical protein
MKLILIQPVAALIVALGFAPIVEGGLDDDDGFFDDGNFITIGAPNRHKWDDDHYYDDHFYDYHADDDHDDDEAGWYWWHHDDGGYWYWWEPSDSSSSSDSHDFHSSDSHDFHSSDSSSEDFDYHCEESVGTSLTNGLDSFLESPMLP